MLRDGFVVIPLAIAAAGLLVLARQVGQGSDAPQSAPRAQTQTEFDAAAVWDGVFAPFRNAGNTIQAEVSTVENWDFAQRYYPRGIRNNNPGNIRHKDPWRGMATEQPDKDFVTFKAPEYGIRAMGKTLANYQRIHGLDTVRGIISRWAPPGADQTQAVVDSYVRTVAQALGVNPDTRINVRDRLPSLVPAIIKHENGMQPYSPGQIRDGLALI